MDRAMPFRVQDDPHTPHQSRLVLSGRVTVAVATELHSAAVSLCGRECNVTVDCAAAEYLDISAIQLLLGIVRELTLRGQTCALVGVSDSLREDFRLAGFAAGARR